MIVNLPEHSYVVGCERLWSHAPAGGMVADRLLITTNIVLEPGAPGYDAAKVAELDAYVVSWAKENADRYNEYHFIEARSARV